MMETQRLILYVALGLVLMLLWQSWIQYTTPTQPPGQNEQVQAGGSDTTTPARDATVPDAPDAPSAPSAPAAPSTPGTPDASTEAPAQAEAGGTIVVETDLIRAELSTIGGDIRKVELLDYPVDVDHPEVPLSLMSSEPPNIFMTETGLLGRGHEFPNHRTEWRIDGEKFTLDSGRDSLEITFSHEAGAVTYRKVYRFRRDSYLVDVEYRVDNGSDTPWSGYQYAQFVRTDYEEARTMGFLTALPSFRGGAIYTPEDRFQKIGFSDLADSDLKRQTESGWVSMLQHYFVGAWLPAEPGPYEFYSSVTDRAAMLPMYRIGYKTLAPVEVAPGASGVLDNRLYIGPKEQDRLEEAAEGLVLSVDYGWLTVVASPLFWLLSWIHKVVGNWGWAIIFLTVLIKLVFFPLSAASYKSMAKMKNLQPRLKTLKDRYGDDRQKFQQEMMKIYKEEKINPLGGCLPILVQIPVFIALYWVLLESVELRQADWFWLKDLSVKDPFYILPILMGLSMLVQQRLNPAPMDDIQKKVMMALPFVFTVFFLFFPSGLVLYWVVNNVLSIAQQWFITNKLQAKS